MSVEDIKLQSKRLRGRIEEDLASDKACFEEEEYQLLKFHGSYQQDNRDKRVELRKQGKDREYIFMIRSRIPGGRLTAPQYLIHDDAVGKFGNGTLRITSRQGLQTHFVVKGHLADCIRTINESGITTWGACGDVVRNVMAAPSPIKDEAHRDMLELAEELADLFAAKSRAYSEIWLNGEKLDISGQEEEPIYGEVYLPRKFKIGIAIPPRNDVDVYTQDIGLAPHIEGGEVKGYTIIAGGGFGMSHGKKHTRPFLGIPMFYVERPHVAEVCKAIVLTQRDHGNREDRKQARMKYLIAKMGEDWFKEQVASRLESSVTLEAPKELKWTTTGDALGWNEQGDGKSFFCVWIPEGRIGVHGDADYRSACRELVELLGTDVAFTPNCNMIFCDIEESQKDQVESILKKYNIKGEDAYSEARKIGMACVALPTCGLALAESERVFQGLLDDIDVHLRELGLDQEPILFRMTGCPNGCARPYNADFAFVGKSPGKYVLFVGGSHRGDRLAGLEQKMVNFDDIPGIVRGYLDEFAAQRQSGESFSDYWGRTHQNGDAPCEEQFH